MRAHVEKVDKGAEPLQFKYVEQQIRAWQKRKKQVEEEDEEEDLMHKKKLKPLS